MYAFILICLAGTLIQVHGSSEKELEGKVALVTGGAKGIGYAITDNFLKNGVKVVIIVDINKPKGMKAQEQFNCKYGNKTMFLYGDITKDLDRIFKIVFKKFGCVDILVNNAGIMDEYKPKKTVKTNAMGTVLWSDRFFNCMRKDRGGKGGTIINIASMTAYYKDPFFYYYKSTKYAILGLTLGMGHPYNYLTSGVRVFAICPGLTRTDMTMSQQMTLDEQVELFDRYRAVAPWQSADAVGKAAVILFKTATTGTPYTVDGGGPPVVSPDRIRKGYGVGIPVWAIHRDPKNFPDPEKFDPERFSDENKHKIKPFTYIPFGLGPRNCIGSRFALCEVKVMTYQLLRHMELSPCEKTCIPVVLDKTSFNMRIRGGHWIRLKPRY